jgi:hypothetical protein
VPRRRTIESIRRRRAFERSWKGAVVSWLLFLLIVLLFVILFGATAIAIRWSFQQGGWAILLGAFTAAGGVFLWILCCSPLSITLRVLRRTARRRVTLG